MYLCPTFCLKRLKIIWTTVLTFDEVRFCTEFLNILLPYFRELLLKKRNRTVTISIHNDDSLLFFDVSTIFVKCYHEKCHSKLDFIDILAIPDLNLKLPLIGVQHSELRKRGGSTLFYFSLKILTFPIYRIPKRIGFLFKID